MAHQIEGNRMIYVGEKPWHDRGVALDASVFAGLTPEQAIAKAIELSGLNYTVSTVQLQMPAVRSTPTNEVVVDGRKVNRAAVIRDSDGSILGFVRPSWTPIQNSKAFSPMATFIAAGCTIETAGCLYSGGRAWMLLKVNKEDSVIDSKTDDRVAKYLVAAVGHDGQMTFVLGYTPTRVVCNNTLSVALSAGEATHVRIRHSKGADAAIDSLKQTIEEIDARFEKTAEVFRALAGRTIGTAEELRGYLAAVFPPAKKATEIEQPAQGDSFASLLALPRTPNLLGETKTTFSGEAPFVASAEADTEKTRAIETRIEDLLETGRGHRPAGSPLTLWHAYNAVTEYATWERGKSIDTRLNNLWIEQSGPTVRALPAAVAMLKR